MASTIADSNLVSALFKLQQKSKLVKSSVYDAPEDPSIKVRSWKMSEHHYYTVPSPFPTLARGLFTTRVSSESDTQEDTGGHYRIVARGYDKFFNMGEVPWNTWDAIAKHTEPPYTLTVKSNGCIILIAALSRTKLLTTSKHSVGSVTGVEKSHSQVGEAWLNTHLQSVGKSREQLAQVLWENNWTAVAELCDDSFEEHVLAYSPERTGLHLHGINRSSAEFFTLPSTSSSPDIVSVDSFAKEWGFIPTVSLTLPSIAEVKKFSDECAATGSWNGEPIEGFVVRTRIRSDSETLNNSDPNLSSVKEKDKTPPASRDVPPYPPGSNFFFKIKYDEPYMMYRDWREITKAYLSAYDKNGKQGLTSSKASKNRLKRLETRVYDSWVREEIAKNPSLFEGYQKNRGIVRTREQFLRWLAGSEGQSALKKETRSGSISPESTNSRQVQGQKTVIVPIAIPGCGKTAVAVALSKLFGFGHTQSDDVMPAGKKGRTASAFENNVKQLLESNDAVIADKNNHLTQHRTALRHLLPNVQPPIRLIALYWPTTSKTNADLHRICGDRILARGENHQTLRPDVDDPKLHSKVLWQFISTSEELVDSEVDEVIEMNLDDSLEEAVKRAVNGLVKLMNLKTPSENAIKEAISLSEGYKISEDNRRQIKQSSPGKSRKTPPRYFALTPETFAYPEICSLIDEVITDSLRTGDQPNLDAFRLMWSDMKKKKRVVEQPHVTVVHKTGIEKNEAPGLQELWDGCLLAANEAQYQFSLTHLIYNGRIVALALDPTSVSLVEKETEIRHPDILRLMPEIITNRLHITVGTRSSDVKPVEARDLVVRWRNGRLEETEGVIGLGHRTATIKSRLEGLWS